MAAESHRKSVRISSIIWLRLVIDCEARPSGRPERSEGSIAPHNGFVFAFSPDVVLSIERHAFRKRPEFLDNLTSFGNRPRGAPERSSRAERRIYRAAQWVCFCVLPHICRWSTYIRRVPVFLHNLASFGNFRMHRMGSFPYFRFPASN